MKKILKFFAICGLVIGSCLNVGNIEAATISSVDSTTQICKEETHYYYFMYPAAASVECSDGSINGVEVNCNTEGAVRNDESTRWTAFMEEIGNSKTLKHLTNFDRSQLPESAVLLKLDTEATTTFTAEDYALMFDALVNYDGSLTPTDLPGVNVISSYNDKVIITKDEEGNDVYNHFHRNWESDVQASTSDNIFYGMRPYWVSRTSKVDQINFRQTIIEGMLNRELSSTATIGINTAEGLQPLNANTVNYIFDTENQVTIQRSFPTLTDVAPSQPMLYCSNADCSMERYVSWPIPAKFKVIIGVECKPIEPTCDEIIEEYEACEPEGTCSEELIEKYNVCVPPERTCEVIEEEYMACQENDSCSESLIAEYEECFPPEPEEPEKNPETADLNLILICLVITGAAVVGVTTYREKKLQDKQSV